MTTFTQKLRTTSLCLITAASIALPAAGYAGWWGEAKPVQKVTKVAKKTTGNAKDQIGQMAGRLDEIYSQIEDNRPLLNALKDGQMASQLTEVVTFLNESQYEYQQFAQDGIYTLRDDIHELVNTVSSIGDSLNLNRKMTDQLQKAAGLIDKMPATFLFALAKGGVDERLQDMLAKLNRLHDDLVLIATLPLPEDVYLYPTSYKADLCPLVNDKKIQVAVLNARIDENIFVSETVSSMMPEDLTINVTVVGGGGATVAKFPPQYIFKAINTMLKAIKLRVNNYKSVAGTMCE